jgi:hypothetical protein
MNNISMKSYIEVDGSVFGSAITPAFRYFFNIFNTLLIKQKNILKNYNSLEYTYIYIYIYIKKKQWITYHVCIQ